MYYHCFSLVPTFGVKIRTCHFAGGHLLHMYMWAGLVPRPCSSVFVQYNTQKRKSAKNGEGLGTPIT